MKRGYAIALGLTLLGAIVVACMAAGGASATPDAPLTWATPCSSDLDVATCERLTWLANSVDNGDGTAAIGLDASASGRLDLVWWAVWLIPGLTVGLWIGSRAWGAYRQWVDA